MFPKAVVFISYMELDVQRATLGKKTDASLNRREQTRRLELVPVFSTSSLGEVSFLRKKLASFVTELPRIQRS